MRFSQLIQDRDVLKIPDTEFTELVQGWTKKMGAKVGYRRETRMEHWQEAIDTVYTALEKELQTNDADRIMKQKKWEIMMLAAKTHFPEHIAIYHPTLVEQQRVGKLVQNSKLRRILKDKLELMRILKQDKELVVGSITELTVSRLQCEVLAASAQLLYSKYQGSPSNTFTTNYGAETEASAGASANREGLKVSAGATATASAVAQASYDSGKKSLKGGFEHRVKAGVAAAASVEATADVEARASELMAAGNFGLSAETRVSADFDYEISRSCKVKTEYLRRIMGDKFKLISGYASGSASAGASASASGSAGVRLAPGLKTSHDVEDPGAKHGKINSADFAHANLQGEVEISVSMSGRAGVTLMQTADIEVSGDLMAGASASGELKFFVNGRGVGMDIGGSAMAGFEVGTDQKLNLKHPSRGISIFSLKVRESFSAGAGVEGKIKAHATVDEISFNSSAGATVGIGTSIGFDTVISPRGALLVGYDLLVVPSILRLGSAMCKHDPQLASVHTQRMKTFCDFLNKQASKGEVNQVYLDCRSRIVALMASLDAEANNLYDPKRKYRTAGVAYQSMSIEEAGKTQLESAYFSRGEHQRQTPLQIVFGSEAGTGDAGIQLQGVSQGDIGKTITQKGLQTDFFEQKTNAVDPAKADLHRVVAAYENAKTRSKGECIAFDVIRSDLLKGTINYS
ncbi:hypothetical protein [Spongorhabdus nitratireducens]